MTYVVITYAQVSKVYDFMDDRKDDLIEDKSELIQAFIISYFADGSDAYVLDKPLYSESFSSDNGLYNLDFEIYNYVLMTKDSRHNSLALIVDNLDIKTSNVHKDEHGRALIDLKIKFSEPIIYNGFEYLESNETFVWVLDTDVALLIINYDVMQNNDGYVDIESLSFSYRTNLDTSSTFLNLGSNVDPDSMPAEINRDLSVIAANNIDLIATTLGDSYLNNELIAYREDLSSLFKSYNSVYFIYIGGLLLFLIPLTYFTFFHSYVWHKMKLRKKEKAKKLSEFKQKLDEENGND